MNKFLLIAFSISFFILFALLKYFLKVENSLLPNRDCLVLINICRFCQFLLVILVVISCN